MKKVAIITLTGENNYGNKLQNYAMEQIMIDSGFMVETVRVENIITGGRKSYHILSLKNYVKHLISPLLDDRKKKQTQRRYLFFRFNKLLHQAKDEIGAGVEPDAMREILNNYDYLVYGSDQIWNPQFSTFSTVYLGEFGRKEKNIAVSASFGLEKLDSSYIELFKAGLQRFKAISVREDAGKRIINNIAPELLVDVLIDPTLMLDASRWEKIEAKPIAVQCHYAVSYFLGKPNGDKLNKINKIKKEHDVSIIDIGEEAALGPKEFLYYIHHADYVCTDSFHAVVFSVLFAKDVYIFKREDKYQSMSSRMDTLINKLNLKVIDFDNILYISSGVMKSEKTIHNIEIERAEFKKFIKVNME